MATSSEILAALDSFRIHLESQLTATNSTIKACMQLVDSKFADLLSTPPSPSPIAAFSPVFRSGGSSSAPQQRCLPNAPLQPPGSSNPGIPFLSFDVTSAAASSSVSAASPPSVSPVPSPSAVFSQPSPPPSAASPSPSAVAFPPSVADSPLPLSSGAVLNRAGFAAAVVSLFAAPPPFLSPTTILAPPPAASGVNPTALLPVELFGKDPDPAPLPPTPEVTPPPYFQIGPQPPPPPPQAHITWFSPLDMEAQSNPFNKYQDVVAVASRRGVIFSLYALEEIYKDIFESPP